MIKTRDSLGRVVPISHSWNWNEEIDKMVSLLEEGLYQKDIAKIYGVTKQTISKVFLQKGIHTVSVSKKAKQEKLNKIDKTYLAQYKKFKVKGYRCTQQKIQFDLVFEDIIWPTICPVLGTPLDYFNKNGPNVATFDRIDPKLGYVKGNVKIISFRANTIKNDGTVEELEKVIRYIKEWLP